MATINTKNTDKIYSIQKWYGINESPDGDTKLKYGEASVMKNFCVTADGNLRKRNGASVQVELTDTKVYCLWRGNINGNETVLAASDNKLFSVYSAGAWNTVELGSIGSHAYIFGFGGIAYIIDGEKYRQYDGTTYKEVEGYEPLVSVATEPSGGGTLLEQVNKLTGKRHAYYSPDGTATVYKLPENPVVSVDSVIDLTTGTEITGYTVNVNTGEITFSSAPESGISTIDIHWTVNNTIRSEVERMRFSELFNGYQDSRVFLYGDGSNTALYSGLDTIGNQRADYFPDMNIINVGDKNSPITAMIRHYNRLICYKSDSAHSIAYSTITLEDGSVIPSFTVANINKSIGCSSYGQAVLVMNNPFTVFGNSAYEWYNTSSLSVADERQAKLISDKVRVSLSTFDLRNCLCFNDPFNKEYYVIYNKNACIYNYGANAWYYYTDFDCNSMIQLNGDLYYGSSDGNIVHFSKQFRDNCGEAIDAVWQSGAMDFNSEYMRKYTSNIWISVKPETNSYLEISVSTDSKKESAVKEIVTGSGGFSALSFASFTFNDDKEAFIKRLRIKSKKYSYYKLILRNNKLNTSATILSADIRTRSTGYAK